MKEILELRVNYNFAHLLFSANEGKDIGQLSKSIKIVELSREDPRYNQIQQISKYVKEKYNQAFFFGWQIKRKYSKKEFNDAKLLHVKIKSAFEPAGEECGTMYDETVACEICGANRRQIGPLKLKRGSIPKKDIARTIAGEVVVSEKFAIALNQRELKGILLDPVVFDKKISQYYQLVATKELELTTNTIAGDDPFKTTEGSNGGTFDVAGYAIVFEKEVYKCPKGHLIGLNLLSEPCVSNSLIINDYDFFASKQKTGVKRGLLRPEPVYLCSPAFRKMVDEEKLSGFEFEIANIE